MVDCADYIRQLGETRGVEYKRSQTWEDARLAITKTALGMVNLPGGGAILVGMRKEGEIYLPEGVRANHLDTYKQDDVSTFVNERASSPIEMTVSRCDYDGKTFVVIQVNEFPEYPVICTRDGHSQDGTQQLRRGALYMRSLRRVETAEVATEAEMRQILQRAIDKGVERELSRLRQWGLIALAPPSPQESVRERFETEREGL